MKKLLTLSLVLCFASTLKAMEDGEKKATQYDATDLNNPHMLLSSHTQKINHDSIEALKKDVVDIKHAIGDNAQTVSPCDDSMHLMNLAADFQRACDTDDIQAADCILSCGLPLDRITIINHKPDGTGILSTSPLVVALKVKAGQIAELLAQRGAPLHVKGRGGILNLAVHVPCVLEKMLNADPTIDIERILEAFKIAHETSNERAIAVLKAHPKYSAYITHTFTELRKELACVQRSITGSFEGSSDSQ